MNDNNELLKRIETYEAQERILQFEKFSYADALDVGLKLVVHAKNNNFAVLINIEVNGFQIFRYAFEGTSIQNERWVRRKINSVNVVQKSSLLIGAMLERDNKDLGKDWHLDAKNFTHHGGAFPIRIKGTGMIGTICVSGRPQQEDHQIIVDVLCDYLKKQID